MRRAATLSLSQANHLNADQNAFVRNADGNTGLQTKRKRERLANRKPRLPLKSMLGIESMSSHPLCMLLCEVGREAESLSAGTAAVQAGTEKRAAGVKISTEFVPSP